MSITELSKLIASQLREALDQISVERSKPKVDTGKIYLIATQAIMDGLDLSSSMVFIREEHEGDCFAARHGHGDLFKAFRNRP